MFEKVNVNKLKYIKTSFKNNIGDFTKLEKYKSLDKVSKIYLILIRGFNDEKNNIYVY